MPGTNPVTVKYVTQSWTAAAGWDYESKSGTLSFLPGETAKTVRIDIVNDTSVEAIERFRLNLSAPLNALKLL